VYRQPCEKQVFRCLFALHRGHLQIFRPLNHAPPVSKHGGSHFDGHISEFHAHQLSFELWNVFVLNAGPSWGRESKQTGVPHAGGQLFHDRNSLRYREPSPPKLIVVVLSCHAVTPSAES
jgi:hypothetical protein